MSSALDHLKRQIIRHKELLVNVSRKNRELFYRESKGSTINLSKQPFEKSAFKEKTEVQFSPLTFTSETFTDLVNGKSLDLNEFFQLEDVAVTDVANKLYAKLDKIRLVDDRHQREYGISGAWVLGPFLCWRIPELPSRHDLLVTPIFKLPVDLKKNAKKALSLCVEDGTVAINPTLRFCLKTSLGLTLPADNEFESISQAFEIIQKELSAHGKHLEINSTYNAIPKYPSRYKTIKGEDGEPVQKKEISLEESLSKADLEIFNKVTFSEFLLLDAIYIDQLNASRMVLLNDYDDIIEAGIDHPILNELFNGTTSAEQVSTDRSKLKELDSYTERYNHFVIDIDSTQHRAIDAATKSKAIVIQGPPGAGKSQTIVNLIADYLSKGKKILFVSDKRPALDVVYNRMKSANIESQAVLIHSSDLNKSELYNSYLQLAGSTPNTVDELEWKNVSSTLDRTKKELNQYATILQTNYGSSNLSNADVLILSSKTNNKFFNRRLYEVFKHFSYEDSIALESGLNDLQTIAESLLNFSSSPWLQRHKTTIRSNTLEHKLQELIKIYSSNVNRRTELVTTIKELTGQEPTKQIIDSIKLTPENPKVDTEHSTLWGQKQTDITSVIVTLIGSLRRTLQKVESNHDLYKSIKPDTKLDIIAILETYYKLPRGFADWFSGAFWSHKKLRQTVCTVWDGTARQFEGYREYVLSFEELKQLGLSLSTNVKLNIANHAETTEWVKFQIKHLEGLKGFFSSAELNLPNKLLSQAKDSLAGFNNTLSSIELIKQAWSEISEVDQTAQESWKLLSEFLAEVPKFEDIQSQLRHLSFMESTLDQLNLLDKFDTNLEKTAQRFDVSNLRNIILTEFKTEAHRWGEILMSSILNGWTDEVMSEHPPLRFFDRTWISNLVAEFKTSADRHQQTSRQAVHQAFAKRWTDASDKSGLSLLKRESTKQRKILSPREIMEKGALKTMMELKPCWLMSPLSISQMLPLQKCLFDVIIFDEASQVRVEDAIPSIYRAATMIVVGDNKQMPPTNFFSGTINDDDEDDDQEPIAPSVLDLATLVYPSVLLEWHYRSRSESLIAFSNRAFYGGKLIAAPNPQLLTASGALKFVRVENAYFNAKDGNQAEARATIDLLVGLIKEKPNRSFGVIAMGQRQAATLEEILDLKKQEDPRIRALIENAEAYKEGDADAGLFIKNLENVQGDERDVIIMSVGYAPAAEGKKLRKGFGPLSISGGGRRLNVAVTRAKHNMHVMCSFSPSELESDEEAFNGNPDSCIFARYLKYAEAVSTDNLGLALSILNSFPMAGVITSRKSSRFALDVKRRLEDIGYKVSAEIGTSGFFIDLGIHHPKLESNFAVGIECDGAMFHSTPYARDRDKIREDLLKSRGWKIERVWSQDWSKNWKAEIERLDSIIKNLV